MAGLLLGMGGTWWATVRGIDPAQLLWPAQPATAMARLEAAMPAVAIVTPQAEPATHAEMPTVPQLAMAELPLPPAPKPEAQPPAAADASERAAPAEISAAPAQAEPEAKEPPPPKSARAGATRQAKKRSPPVARQDRSEEIDRLRTQAFSETRKDRVSRINGAPAKVPISATRRAFNQCDRATNILRRELCRWHVCGGRWGRNGCPSYESKQASLN